jgi:hypothetical protein
MEKGITIDQVARVCKGFRDAGILVHAYLMYGFPTQTEQETIDSLDIVRQLFREGLLHSGHWHQFAMTAHSPVGKDPAKYHVIRTGPEFRGFANNDLYHDDPEGADHEKYGDGLKKALYNYMHLHGFDLPLPKFFSFPVPKPKVHPNTIAKAIQSPLPDPVETPGYRLLWHNTQYRVLEKTDKGYDVVFTTPRGSVKLEMPEALFSLMTTFEQRLPLFAENPLPLKEALDYLSQHTGLEPEEIIRQEWWKKWRSGVAWVIRM